MKKLTAKQQRFVEEYVIDFNGTQAAIRAGYSKKTARQIGSENLSKLYICESIQKQAAKLTQKAELTAEHVIAELRKLAFFDVRKIFDENGELLPIHELPDEVAACVSSVEFVKRSIGGGRVEYVQKVRAWDKKGALELLGRHFASFTDNVNLGGEVGIRKIERRIVDPDSG